MTISIGDHLPDVSFSKICNGALENISVEKLAKRQKAGDLWPARSVHTDL